MTLKDGWLFCSFKREKFINNVKNYFDLNNRFYILAATGPYSLIKSTGFTGTIQIHTSKTYSSTLVNFDSFKKVSGGINKMKVKIHGNTF